MGGETKVVSPLLPIAVTSERGEKQSSFFVVQLGRIEEAKEGKKIRSLESLGRLVHCVEIVK